MSLLSIDIARLIHHHLLKEGYENSANNLISECPHLKGLKPVKHPYKLPRLLGLSLADLFESYFETKENVIEELELLESVVFREHDSLPLLTKTLVENLKSPTLSKSVQKETCSKGVNTEVVIENCCAVCDASVNTVPVLVPENCDASVNTDSVLVPKNCDASVNTDSFCAPKNCDACVNTEAPCSPKTCDSCINTDLFIGLHETCDASVNTETYFNPERTSESNALSAEIPEVLEKTSGTSINNEVIIHSQENNSLNHATHAKSPPASERTKLQNDNGDANMNPDWTEHYNIDQENNHTLHCSEQLVAAETVDFSLVYDRLLENREFQEKIAENINKKKAEVVLPYSDNSKCGSLASSQDLDTVIKAIVAETQADPAFDNFLKDCIGIDSEDQTSVGTPDSIAPNESEPNPTPNNSDNQENCLVLDDVREPMLVEQPTITPSFITVPSSDLTGSSLVNTLNSVAIVTSSGQITLVPTIISAMPGEAGLSETVSSTITKRVKKKQTMVPRRAPVRIAPKPIFTITIPALDDDYSHVPTTACEAEPGVQEQDTVENQINQQQSVGYDLLTRETPGDCSPGPSSVKPIMKIKNRPLAKSRRTKNSKTRDPIFQRQTNPPPSEKNLTSNLAALLKIAEEYRSSNMDVPNQEIVGQTEPAESPEVTFSTPVPDSSGFVTTPTSTRRRSHVRQLNFGESPELPNKPVPKSPAAHPKRSEIPWDLALRNAFAAPPTDSEIFATPKGKAKRKRKSSPMPETSDAVAIPDASSNEVPINTSPSKCSRSPAQASDFNLAATEENITPAPVTEERSQPCTTSDSNYADLVAASILHEMANTPLPEVTREETSKETATDGVGTQCVVSTANLSQFGMDVVNREEHVVQHFALPVLATPRKEITDSLVGSYPAQSVPNTVLCDGQSNSVSFGAWDGEIPRTPQIRMDLTSSTSPFQVSLTKGFRFLPAADSPSLAVPSTPCILEAGNSNASIDTPYVGFYQFPSVLSTPRLEALRQEIMESPGKSLSMTVISPTQVVLGRPTPYFVPSGERAQGPIVNQNATPEHVPEQDKLDRRRRSSMEMDPLQLEESNDASDAAAALMCKAAENVAAALHPPTPYKTDQTLENDLINECQRLEDVPSPEKFKQRNQRLIELFGEDSTNLSEGTKAIPSAPETVMEAALAQSTPIITKQKTGRPRRTAPKKAIPIDEAISSGCARVQVYAGNPQANRRKSKRPSKGSKPSTSLEDEAIIQELLAMSRSNNSYDVVKQSPLRKKKRRSHSLNREQSGSPSEVRTEKKPTRKQNHLSGFNDVMTIGASTSTSELLSVSNGSSPNSSREEVDVVELVEMVESPLKSPRKNGKSKKTTTSRKKSSTRQTRKACSSTSFGMETRRTPVKLFKSAPPPYARKAISYRQSATVKKTPTKVSPGESASATNVSHEDTGLERYPIEAVNMPVTVSLAKHIQTTEDFDRVVECDGRTMDKRVASPVKEITENTDGRLGLSQQAELLVETENSNEETAPSKETIKEPLEMSPPIAVESSSLESERDRRIKTANEKCAAESREVNAETIVSSEPNPIAVPVMKTPASPASTLLSRNNSEKAENSVSLPSVVISDAFCEKNHQAESTFTIPIETAKFLVPLENVVVETNLEESSQSSNSITDSRCEKTLHSTEALAKVNDEVALSNFTESTLPQKDVTVKSNQELSSPQVTAAKEKINRSNSKLQNYLRLSSFNSTPDCSSKRKSSTLDATILSSNSSSPAHPKPFAVGVCGQLPLPETAVFMHKDLVKKIRKQIGLSKEIDLYSQ
ncbi:hypothetical protein GHT06_010349 [Daphnia sinensis]|uniref:LisH domain-containing protein n=1 Tax=Daphnia sinensis TaxID=1820382 RepID=A0AAD5LRY9_9CRUS|nr:hypothetical protein GHT06_010349 [Daphnia sinensis]